MNLIATTEVESILNHAKSIIMWN